MLRSRGIYSLKIQGFQRAVLKEKAILPFLSKLPGEAKGRAEGEAKGRAEGEAKGRADTARNLLQMGFDAAQIAQATGLSLEEVQSLSGA